MKLNYPTYNIKQLNSNSSLKQLLVVDSFKQYYEDNPHVKQLHNHSFFHLLLFTSGEGFHIIDFEKFDIEPGMLYVMKPGQVHQWHFRKPADGYIINFSPLLFDALQISSQNIINLPLFKLSIRSQVQILDDQQQQEIITIVEQIRKIAVIDNGFNQLLIAHYIMDILLKIHGYFNLTIDEENHHSKLYQSFLTKVDQQFKKWRLPKSYAAELHITPAYLNQICKQNGDLSAGDIIRNRVLLESKRLLANLDLTVAEVSDDLNFSDYSNFTKFFKKYTGLTPESFRKTHYL